MFHPKTTITLPDGTEVQAIAPVIVSASRANDIPTFYSEWLMNRLRAGYCVWRNPYNGQPQYVSFKNLKVIVFWTKNPAPLMPRLKEIDEMGVKYYFQYTLNNYVEEILHDQNDVNRMQEETNNEIAVQIEALNDALDQLRERNDKPRRKIGYTQND